MSERLRFALLLVMTTLLAGAAVAQTAPSPPAALAAPTAPFTPLRCVDVSPRWQLCGSTKPLSAGIGIRFAEILPDGRLRAAGSEHDSCDAAARDPIVGRAARAGIARICRANFAGEAGRALLQSAP